MPKNIKAKYNFIKLNSWPFEQLLEKANSLSECNKEKADEIINYLESIETLILELRENKSKIGTNFHLTLTTRRILDYTKRIKELINLKMNIGSKKHWEIMFSEFIEYSKYKDSVRRYIGRHSDLVAMQIVEHTSNKGEHYIAEDSKEYWSFFKKSWIKIIWVLYPKHLFRLLLLWFVARMMIPA